MVTVRSVFRVLWVDSGNRIERVSYDVADGQSDLPMSASGRGCVKRASILPSMGQRTTLAMNRQQLRLLVPL